MVIRAWREESTRRVRVTVVGGGGAILCGMSEKSSLISDTGADAQKKQGREWAQRASREKH